jgi:hypothetical protein
MPSCHIHEGLDDVTPPEVYNGRYLDVISQKREANSAL